MQIMTAVSRAENLFLKSFSISYLIKCIIKCTVRDVMDLLLNLPWYMGQIVFKGHGTGIMKQVSFT